MRSGNQTNGAEIELKYSSKVEEIEPFKVMDVLARARQLESAGHPVVHLEVGEPDFPTPASVVAAGEQALRLGQTRYTPAEGLPELRDAIAAHYAETYGLDIAPGRIFVTAGGSGALLMATALLLNPGESLLMADPGYPCNRHFLTAFGAKATLIPVGPEQGYQLTADDVSHHWDDSTRGVLVASPANPTGAVLKESELAELSYAISARGGVLLADEIYHGLTYGNRAATSALQVDSDAVVINSFSKYFGMTGWRLGWLIVPESAVDYVTRLAQNLFICPSSIAQYAALAAFTPEAKAQMEANRAEFETRRDFLTTSLRELGFDVPLTPEGAFYVYAKLPDHLPGSEIFCKEMLENHYVAITPGTDFGFFEANRHVRFSFAQPVEALQVAVQRLGSALAI